MEDLLGMNVVPVFNENDAISKGMVKSTVSPHCHAFVLISARWLEFGVKFVWLLAYLVMRKVAIAVHQKDI